METNHIDSKVKIHNRPLCRQCPSRLSYKDGETIKLGFGNIYSNKVIILPSYSLVERGNYTSCLSILTNIISYYRLCEDYYVTRDIKCWNVSSYDTHDTCEALCAKVLEYELKGLSARNLFVFGNVNLAYIDQKVLNKFIVHRLFNPYVMLVGEQAMKDKFLDQVHKMMSI